eukprot:gnl/TRDRNA2_/TRDRNA2_39950_c0_seq1.p1 gnl/TRDRNA2_/TRDRNA2_39950_c0~~gnl/TRDRNA2_/TRDRNA2_39950_c0_seq1.p1  ORF type:complete len:235 (+),score=49.05 gnl/TRDRNA2_/TRDRNA2_39950_c0_seq1:57-707(+)
MRPAPVAVVFDMGGVLGPDADYKPLHQRLPEGADKSTVTAAKDASWKEAKTVPGFPMDSYWRPIMEVAGLPLEEWHSVDAEMREGFTAFWQVLAVVDRLRRTGLRVGIISNHICAWFDHWFARFGLKELFAEPDLVIVSSKVRSAKPDAAIYELFCQRSGLQASECVFVDDKKENVAAAEALGFRGILFRHIGKDGNMKDTADTLVERLRAHSVPL